MTPSTIIFNQGDVVLVNFPFTNGVGSKTRPALVISGLWYNRNRSDCILTAITSSIRLPIEQDQIHVTGKEVQEAGLAKESVILAGVVFTIERSLIIRRLGRINRAMLNEVHNHLKNLYDLP